MRKPLRLLLAITVLGLAGCGTTGHGGKETPDDRLSDAIFHQDLSAVERYVKKGDPNGRARSGDSMLSWAYKQNNPKIVQLLVSRGASVKTRGGYSNQSAIHFARSKEMLEYLLSQGADIRELDGDGQPPGFGWAHEKPDLWRVFVAHGADTVPRDRNGQSWDEHVQSYN